jgi:2-keto-4-pentenoate hydratase/2-oxohepta-3-ene-1,7-dioic acid hydratase in catechol pathway
MRLARCVVGGDTIVGAYDDGGITPTGYTDMLDLIRDGEAGLKRARAAVERAPRQAATRLLAPLRPRQMLFCGVNYPDHAEENPNALMPTEPFFFSKLPSAVVGPGEPIVIPSPTTQADYEVELAVVIGRRARHVSRAQALQHVFGYTAANDVSARNVQFKDNQITLGKNPDSFAPIGPVIVTADELIDPSDLHVATYVNGERRQYGATKNWLFDVPALIEFVTRTITLEPGDLMTTGTPSGVAAFRDPPPWLAPGDEVTVEIDKIGRLTNPVVAGWTS